MISGISITLVLIIPEILTVHLIFVLLVTVDDIAKTFCRSFLFIPEQAVASDFLGFIHQYTSAKQTGFVVIRIVVGILCLHHTFSRCYRGRPRDMGQTGMDIIIQGVGFQIELWILQFNVIVEHGVTRLRIIFSPIAGQHILVVYHLTSFEEVTEVIKTVIVKRIRIKFRSTMRENHITPRPCHLLIAIIIGIVTHQRQRVALL